MKISSRLLIAAIVLPMSQVTLAEEQFSLSFGPAPANLANTSNAVTVGYDVVNVDVEGSDGMTATTMSIAKKSRYSKTKSAKYYYYYTNIDASVYDSASGAGFGGTFTWGNKTGIANIVGVHFDFQYFETSVGDATISPSFENISFDYGIQTHRQINESLVAIPWAKYSYIKSHMSFGYSCGATYCPAETPDQDSTFGGISLGMDLKWNDISLGAMYQSSEKTKVTTMSLSYDF